MKPLELRDWLATFDYSSNDATATALVHERIPGSSMLYGICTMESIPAEQDEDGEWQLVTEGGDAERLRELLLILRAPELLKAVKQAAIDLEEVTGLRKPDAECGTWCDKVRHSPTDVAWKRLANIQWRLERMAELAEDLDAL